jgi:hypothetical protein
MEHTTATILVQPTEAAPVSVISLKSQIAMTGHIPYNASTMMKIHRIQQKKHNKKKHEFFA